MDNRKDKEYIYPPLKKYEQRFKEYETLAEKFPRIMQPLNYQFIKLMGVFLFVVFPFTFFNSRGMTSEGLVYFLSSYLAIGFNIFVFFWNQNVFIPRFFFRRKFVLFILANFGCLLLTVILYQIGVALFSKNILGVVLDASIEKQSIVEALIKYFLLSFFVCFMNLGLFVATLQGNIHLKRNLKKNIESESQLEFLRRQLNPHFLFNSMNNVISMMDIDVKKAQSQMFDLVSILRTLLYDNRSKTVSLGKEIEFIEKFIDLEKMRFDESVEISFESNCLKSETPIASLLFLPLIENAFKHSLNLTGNSFIRIKIFEENNCVIYTSKNTNFPRKAKDGVSSGIGLDNLQKRLELIYPEKHIYETSVEENIYKVFLKIDLSH